MISSLTFAGERFRNNGCAGALPLSGGGRGKLAMTVVQLALSGALAVVLFGAAALICAWGLTILKLLDLRATRNVLLGRKPPAWRPDPVRVRKIERALERRAKADAARPGLS